MNERNLDMIRRNCAANATREEFEHFMYLADQFGLDPIKKEIYFLKYTNGKAPSIFTSRDGFLKIAQLDLNFDGLEGDAVYVGDKLTKRPNGSYLIEYGDAHMEFDKNQLRGAFCNVYRKDRSIATAVFVSNKDYNTGQNTWAKYPNAMILKVAEAMALKRAFSISGISSKEEVGQDTEETHTIEDVYVGNVEARAKDLGKIPTIEKPMQADKVVEIIELISKEQLQELEDELIDHPEVAADIIKKMPGGSLANIQKTNYRAAKIRIREIVNAHIKMKMSSPND